MTDLPWQPRILPADLSAADLERTLGAGAVRERHDTLREQLVELVEKLLDRGPFRAVQDGSDQIARPHPLVRHVTCGVTLLLELGDAFCDLGR